MDPSRRQLILLFACGTLPVMTTASLAPVLPALHAAFHNDRQIDMLSRMVLTTPALAIALGASFAGYLLDRLGRRGVLMVSLALFALFGSQGLWTTGIRTLIVARFVFGLGVAGIMTATATLMADFFQLQKLRRMVGLQAALMGVWGVISQTSSGWLAETSWRQSFLLYLVALPLLPAVCLWMPRGASNRVTPKPLSLPSRHIPMQAVLLGIYSMVAMSLFVIVPIQAPFYFGHRLGIGPSSTALLVSALTGASSLTSLAFAVWPARWSEKIILSLGFILMASGLAMLALWTDRLVLVAGMVAIGCGIGSIIPCINVWIAELVSPSHRGRAMGLLTSANYIGQFLTPVWSQGLLEAFGYEGLFLAAAQIALIQAVFLGLSLRRMKTATPSLETEIAVFPSAERKPKKQSLPRDF